MDEKVAMAVVSDLHINSTVALCPSSVQLDDGGTYFPSHGQKALLKAWSSYWDQVKELSKGYKVIVVLNGDLVELDVKRRSHQVVTRNRSTILDMTADLLEPGLSIADAVYVVRGTESHVGKSSNGDELVARDIDTIAKYSERVFSYWELRLVASGVRFDIAHYTSMGRLPWTEKNAANKLAAITLNRYLSMGAPVPHVAVRSHVHRYSDSGNNFDDYGMFAVTTPAWSLKTSYANGYNMHLSSIGGLLFLCDNGEYDYHKITYKPQKTGRSVWKNKV